LHDFGNFVSRFAGQVISIATEELKNITRTLHSVWTLDVRLDGPRKADRHGHIIRRGIFKKGGKPGALPQAIL
jgi:hypothetical protein